MGKKACIVSMDFPTREVSGRSGPATAFELVGATLARMGYDVHLVTRQKVLAEDLTFPCVVHVFDWFVRGTRGGVIGYLSASIALAVYLFRLCWRERFVKVHITRWPFSFLSVILLGGRACLWVFTSESQVRVASGERVGGRGWKRWILGRLLRARGVHLLSPTHSHAIEVAEELGVAAEDLQVVPLMARGGAWARDAPAGGAVAYVGALGRRKGVDTFLEAALRVCESRPDVTFLVIGREMGDSGHETWAGWLGAFAEQDGNLSRIRFMGSLSDRELEEHLSEIQIVVVPSRYESFGLVIPEAFAWRRAVILSDHPVLREVGGEGALYFVLDNAGSLSAAIIRLLDDASLREDLVRRGWERYLALYSVDAFELRLERVMRLGIGES